MNTLTIIPYEGDFLSTEQILSRIDSKDKTGKVCYISLNKTYSYFMNNLAKGEIDRERLFVIDGATSSVNPDVSLLKATRQCYYLKSLNILKELETAKKAVDFSSYQYIIFDSLSTLSVYHTGEEVDSFIVRFANDILPSGTEMYLLSTRPYFGSIVRILEEKKVKIIQTEENNYVIKFELELFLDLVSQLDGAVSMKNKKESEGMYRKVMYFYKSIKDDDVSPEVKQQIYDKCTKYAGLIEKIK